MSYPQFDQLIDFKKLKRAYKSTQVGARKYREAAILFDMARERNLVELWREIKNETYLPRGYTKFSIFVPKERVIYAPVLRDKIVQYALHEILMDIYEPVFIADSYASLRNKGAHKAVDAVQHYMRLCKWQHGDGWIIKMDVSKFFYSIDPDILKTILRKKIKDEKFLRVLDATIDSSPEADVGIPLGCSTSQDFANIYLNEVDQYAKRCLGCKWYVRYMDDIIVILPTKEMAIDVRERLVSFLEQRLALQPHPNKTKIFPLEQGVNAFGYKIFCTHRLIRDNSKRAMKRRIKTMDRKFRQNEIKLSTVKQGVSSWLGHARHSNSYNLAKKIFERYKYIKVEHPDYLFGKKPKPSK